MRISFREAAAGWWADYINTGIRPSSQRNQRLILDAHLIPALGSLPIEQITPHVIDDYLVSKLRAGSPMRHPDGLAPATVRKHYFLICMVLRWAQAHDHIAAVPQKTIRIPVARTEIEVFTREEVETLIACARPHWLGDVILLAFRTGMRRGEILALQWDDVDFDDRYLMVRHNLTAFSPHDIYFGPPKTKSSVRRIDLDDASMDMLRRRQGSQKTPSDWIFGDQYGRRPNPWYITKYFSDAQRAASIPHRGFHALRHTHATLLISKNVNPRIVQYRLGHADVAMTLGTYSHVLPTMQDIAVAVLNSLTP